MNEPSNNFFFRAIFRHLRKTDCGYNLLDAEFLENTFEGEVKFTPGDDEGMILAEYDESERDATEEVMGTLKYLIEKTNVLLEKVIN